MQIIPEHHPRDCEYLKDPLGDGCYHCCNDCNLDNHRCHFCGEYTDHFGYEYSGGQRRRHWLSDCRPDLVEHPIGPLCTWAYRRDPNSTCYDPDPSESCYAYQNPDTREWTQEHIYFHTDGKTS